MPLKNYSLLEGKPIDWVLDDDSSPHVEVLLDVAGEKFRAAINVRSQIAPHTLLYKRIQPFNHQITTDLDALVFGVYDLTEEYTNLALDYPRNGMVQRSEMEELPYSMSGPNNDLKDKLIPIVEDAIASSDSRFYFFGETWGPESDRPDKYFHFTPGRGIHDIHMNQGSQGRFTSSNGINQDGALFIKQDNIWTAIFLAFSTQCWKTDDRGNCTSIRPPLPDSSSPIQIIAALINPFNPEPGKESVTLLNISDQNIRLNGWKLQDANHRAESLDGFDLGAGDTLRIRLTGQSMQLKNKDRGKIRLVSPDDVIVQEVTYQKVDVRREGWSLRT